jgi:hypothetical protein
MIDLRRLPAVTRDAAAHEAYRRAWAANDDAAESRILEITELAYILEADGFPEPEIFRRIGAVFPPAPDLERLSLPGDPVRVHAVEHLTVHAPAYIELGPQLLTSALVIAELWAVRRADRLRDSHWPPQHMLSAQSVTVECCLRQANDAADETDAPRVTSATDVMAALDALIKRSSFPANPELRRVRARAIPGDRLLDYSTGEESFRFKMGSAGFALVRNGRAIDFMETIRN